MKEDLSLNHTKWDCKYHVVFVPNRRKKQIFGVIRKYLDDIFHELARQQESTMVAGHLRADYVRMCLILAPKFFVAPLLRFRKGSSAISSARNFTARKRNVAGESLSAPATSSPRSASMMARCANPSEIRTRRTNVWNSSSVGAKTSPFRAFMMRPLGGLTSHRSPVLPGVT
jgi:putative transposase